MNQEIVVLLREIGLEEKEITLYLALIGKRKLTAYVLAKETKINRIEDTGFSAPYAAQ